MQNFTLPQSKNTFARIFLFTCMLFFYGLSVQAQIGVQSPSIRSGVTFSWSDIQDVNNNGDIDDSENNRPATISAITINGTLYNNFAVPSAYQLTRLGPAGHGPNQIVNNASYSTFNSSSATLNITDSNQWDNAAKAAFQSQNLNNYFTSNPNGRDICGNFNVANGMNGATETDAQLQTLYYSPPLPANAGGVLAVTERGGNNCFYIRLFGFLPGSTVEQSLGDTFVRTNGDLRGGKFSPPSNGGTPNNTNDDSDYWGSGREQDNEQTIAIALFQLDNVAPIGSKITRIRFVAASNDHGDGKLFVLQRYAQPQIDMGCVNGTFNGQINNSTTVPAGSTYTLVSGPTPAGTSFTLNTDGSYQYVPTPGFIGDVTFTYKVRLPAPNQNITDTNTVTLTYNPKPPNPEIEVSCNENGDYNILVTTPVGGNFEYQINNEPYQASPNFTNLGPGTYVFSVRNLVTGCENKPSSTSITLDTLMGSIISVTDLECFGDDDGAIDIAVTGGFPPYSFLWSNGATTEDISNLSPGAYNVQIFDTSGCMFEFLSDIVIEGPSSGISLDKTITDVLCFGGATGAIDISVSGGTPGYSFSWSNGATTEDIAGLTAGEYTVTILDANNCSFEKIFEVKQPSSGIQLSTEVIDVSCFGESTASIDLMISGGVPPYSYAWSNGATTQDLSNIPAGTYNVIVTDDNGCSATLPTPVEVTQPEPISIELTKTNANAIALCNNGTATATVSGGTPPYTYQWNDPASQITATATGLFGSPLGGTQYTVVITDANGCKNQQSIIITCVQDCDAVIDVTNVTNILCKGDNTGSATVSASSAANPNATFTFTWNTTPVQVDANVTTSTILNQFAGVYTVSVTIDGTLCQPVEESVTITEPSTAVSVTATATDETGPTTNDGTATANPSGGIPPYTYLWSPGGQTTQTITGLSDGTYTVTVTDANGCEATTMVTVNDGDCKNLSANASSTPVSCNGGNDGTATVNVSGGLGNFTYLWSPGGQTTQTISGLTAGVYTVTVTDTDTQCTASSSTTVNQPTKLTSGIAVTNVACFGESTGSLDLTVSGGTSPYSFLWNNGATTEDISNLPAGSYSVVITDANGCVKNDQATVRQPSAALAITITSQDDIVCEGTGSVMVQATGGTAPYSYSLDGGAPQSSGTFANLVAGTYTISVVDANVCSKTVSVTILENCTIAVNDFRDTVVNVPITGNVLTNDEDLEGDDQVVTTLTVTSDQGVVVNIAPDGTFTYNPPTNYTGGDFFMYSIEDNGNPQATDSATVFIRINPIGQNNTIANADAVFTEVNVAIPGNVLTNDVDLEGDNQTVTNPGTYTLPGGVLVLNANGTFVYTPNSGFTGTDTFTYNIVDDNVNPATDSAVLTITVVGDPAMNYTFAVDDGYGGNQGATITGNLLDNDFDPEGDDQFVDIVISPSSGPAFGTVVLNADGSFTYTPNDPNFSGNDSFVYSIFDNGAPVATDSATVSILIAGQNLILAIDDINNTYVGLPVDGNVATNDENYDGPAGTETFTLVSGPTAGGILVFNPDGTYSYTPPVDPSILEDTFVYQICDAGNPIACDTATVYIEILPIPNTGNEPPVANADTNITEVNTPVSGFALPNDFDPDGDSIVVTANTDPTNGAVVINPDGSYVYTPNLDFIGEDIFTYTICDNQTPALCDKTTVTIQVIANNGNITVANDDAYNGIVDTVISGNLLDNDTDPEGDDQMVDVAISPSNGPTNGTVVLNADGTFTYTPNAGYVGTDQFVYSIFDTNAQVATDQATVYLTVGNGVNEILAIDDINDTFVNLPVSGDVSTNDKNYDGPAGTEVFTLVTGPTNGTLTFNPDGTYTYVPGPGYIGEDTFVYQVCDGGNPVACDTATVYIEVQPVGSPSNEPPVANADTNSTQVDTPVDGTVLPNDYDPDGDPIVVTANTPPSNGTVTINPDGTYTYTPAPGFEGEDTFTYTICDNQTPALCDTATVTIQVLGSPENITTAVDDAYYGFPDAAITGNVLDNDTDPEGDNQTVDVAVSPSNGPSNGTVVLNADGIFTYTPNPSYVGTDSFVYEIFDNGTPVARDRATVYISINPTGTGNEILAIDDINDTFVDLPVNGDVSTNDINTDGPAGTEVFTLVTGPTNGTLTFNPDGTYTYVPGPGYIGEDTFVYQVCDGGNPVACDTATVYIEVQPVGSPSNEPPVANADTNSTQVGVPVDGTVLPNDYDPDGDPIVVTANTPPSNGTVTINPDGTYTYTPAPGFEGEDTFTYTICDNQTPALCDTATVTIQVLGSPENITTAVDDAYYGFPDAAITGNVLDNDTDPEGDNQTVDVAVSPSNGPLNGTVVLNADGTFTYTPNPGYVGTDSFVYEIFDNGTPVARDKATVYISINPTGTGNEILAIDDINDTFVNLPVSGDVSTNDKNYDGPAGTEVFTLVSGPTAGGTLTFNADGTYDYIPALDYVGDDTFVYQICDGGNPIACDTANVTITVVDDPIIGNDPPVAINDVNITEVDVPVDGNVLVNDFDPDLGDTISVTQNTNPTNGTVTVNPNGDYTYTPNPGFTGVDTFEYTICDSATPSLCDSAIVTIYVIGDPGNITIANDDAYYGEVNTVVSGNVLDNDSDPEGNDQTLNVGATPVSGPSNGTVVVNADGSFTYTPGADFTGNDQFVYEIFDNGAPVATSQATVYILIEQTPAPAIAILKSGLFIDGNNDTCADVGEVIRYTFEVTNQGNVPLGNITVTDPLLEAPNPVVPIAFVGGDANGNDLLDIDETWTYTADYAITQVDIDAGEVINQATATGTDEDGTTVDDLSDEISVTDNNPTVTPLCQAPVIAILKSGLFLDGNGNQCADAGESIDYTFTVTNEGNVSLSSITVTDPLLEAPNPVVPIVFAGGDTDGDLELDVDETWTYTASYAITQADIDAGEVVNQATATGTAPDATVVSDLSDEISVTDNNPTVTPLCQAPVIAILKSGLFVDGNGNQCADAGESIDYTFTVTNEGNVSLSTITVTDPLLEAPNPVVPIAFVGGDTDGDLELDVDETWTYTASYAITQADIDAGEVVNQATATGTAPDATVVSDLSDEISVTDNNPTVTPLCQAPVIAILKSGLFVDGNGNQCADAGESIDYTFTVTNEGNVSLSSITVTDPLLEAPNPVVPIVFAGGDTDGDLELDVDETWTYTASYAITQADIDAGEVINQATATGTAPDATVVSDLSDEISVTDNNPTVTPLCQAPVIAILKSGLFVDGNGNQCADAGESIDYTFTVTNEGNVSLSSITVTDPLLEAPNPVVPIVFAGGDTDGDLELDVDETWTYTASYAITQADIDAGEVINQATATGTAPDATVVSDLSDEISVTDNNPTVTPLCQAPVIAILKSGLFVDGNGNQCADAGESIDYTFTVTNEGNVSLSSITVTDPLLEAPNPVVPIVFAGGDTDGDLELDVDETWTYTASYAITQADIDAGEVINQATATGTDEDGTTVDDLSDEVSVTDNNPTVTPLCQAPVIAILKSGLFVDGNGNQCADAGESIDYTFTVTNEGNVSLSSITVTDPLLEAPNPVVPIAFVGGDTDGDLELDVDETWTYTASYAITQADIDAGEVVNQATATGTAPDATVVSDLSDEISVTDNNPTVTPLCQAPVIAILKSGLFVDGNGNQCADAGESIDYTFTVTNEGNVSLSSITVTDPLLEAPNPVVPIVFAGGDTDGDLELDVDETWTYTASYAITQADIDAGEVVNQATATGTAPDATVVSDLSDEISVTDNNPTVTPLCQSSSIAVIKRGTLNDENGNGCTDVGETISYEFEVMNTGNVTLTAVTVNDPLVNVVGGPIELAPGQTDIVTFTAVYSITQVDIDNGSFTNQATAMGTTPNGTVVQDDSDFDTFIDDNPTVTPLCQNASIALIKVGTVMDENNSGCADPKETIDYAFTVMNTGNVTITNIEIDDPLVNVQGGSITLAPGQTDLNSFTATYLITQANINDGFVENQATVRGLDPLLNIVTDLSDDNSFLENDPTITPLCQDSIIALIKTGTLVDDNNNGCVDLGETIVYDFVVTNLGNVVLSNVIVTDPLVTVIGGPISLPAGESDTETFSAEYIVTQDDVDNGSVVNQAMVSGTTPDGVVVSDLSDNNSNFENDPTVSTLCQDPRVSLEKEGIFDDNNGDGIPQPGETITYVFSVRNTGNVTLYNLTLEDDDLAGIIITGGPIPVLLPGEFDETTYIATYAISQDDINNGEVINQAVIRGTTLDGTEVQDTSDDPNDLTNVDPDGDGDPDDPTVVILPNVLPEFPFEIFNGITPDGDGLNDFFNVVGIENFPDNNMKIYNRWGVLVWETDGYGGATGATNVFDGFSNGRATIEDNKLLPTGTYFYILVRQDPNSGETLKDNGYLYINR